MCLEDGLSGDTQVGHRQAGNGFIANRDVRADLRRLAHRVQAGEAPAGVAARPQRAGFGQVGSPEFFRGVILRTPNLLVGALHANHRHARNTQTDDERGDYKNGRNENQLVTSNHFLQPVVTARWAGHDRFVAHVALDVHRQSVGRLVTTRAVLFQALHDDPIQIAPELVEQLRGIGRSTFGRGGQVSALERREPGAWANRFLFADGLAHRVQAGGQQFLGVERCAAHQQLIEQDAQAVDVAACVNIQTAHLCLFRAHVGWRAHKLMQLRINRLVGQPAFRRLGNAEINHLGHGHPIVQRDHDVGGLDVAVDDALLVRVLDSAAHLDHKVQALLGVELILIAVFGDFNSTHQFHHKVRASVLRGSRIEHLGNVGVIHHGQGLAFGFEAGDDLLGIHPQLDDLEGDAAAHRFVLLGDIDDPAAALAHFL